jgi:hypothetical protein
MIGSSKPSSKGGSGVLRAKGTSAARDSVMYFARTVGCAAMLVALIFFAAHTVQVTAKNAGEVLSPGWMFSVVSLFGWLLMLGAIGHLISGSLLRNGQGVLASLS